MPGNQGADRSGHIPEMVSIYICPLEADDRVMPGNWEGDFIKDAGNKSLMGGWHRFPAMTFITSGPLHDPMV